LLHFESQPTDMCSITQRCCYSCCCSRCLLNDLPLRGLIISTLCSYTLFRHALTDLSEFPAGSEIDFLGNR